MAIKSIDLAWVVVTDLKKALKFYTEVLGLKLNEHNEKFGWAEVAGKNGGSILGIAQASGHSPIPAGHNAIVALTVENINESKNEMAKKGAKFIGDIIEVPGIVKLQLLEDADGNKYQLAQNLESNKK